MQLGLFQETRIAGRLLKVSSVWSVWYYLPYILLDRKILQLAEDFNLYVVLYISTPHLARYLLLITSILYNSTS